MPQLFKNNISGVLSAQMSAVATTMSLVDASTFPTPGADFYLATLIGLNGNGQESSWEIVKVTAKSGNNLTVVRAQESTSAAIWPVATRVELRLTAGSMGTKQDTLVSGTNLKTVNGTTLLGSGNLATGDVTTTGAQTLTNKTFSGGIYSGVVDQTGSVRGGITAMGALDVDCSTGNYFTKTISGNSTLTFSNAPASRSFAFTLELTHTSGTVTWPSSVKWPGDTAPTLTSGKTHLFTFVTDDGGTRWRGVASVDYVN